MQSSRFRTLRWTILLLLCGSVALAQDRGFRVHRYDATTAGSWQFLVERPWYSGTRYGAVGVTADASRNLLTPRVATGRGEITPILTGALIGHVDLAGSLFDRLLVSGSLPVTFLETGAAELVSQTAPIQGVLIGDPRVGVTFRVAGQAETDGFSLHVGADAWVPIGNAQNHQGDVSFRARPHVTMAGAFGVGRWAFDGAFLLRPYSSLGPPSLGMTAASEAQAGLALGVSLFGDHLTLGPEARFSTQVVGVNAFKVNGMSAEVLGGANLLIANTIMLGVAGGTGFLGAAGTPDLRGIARLSFAPRWGASEPVPDKHPDELLAEQLLADADGDGIPDSIDRCPNEPELKNGIRDLDGCPEYQLDPAAPLAKVLTRSNPPRLVLPDAGVVVVARPSPVDAGRPQQPTIVDAGRPVERVIIVDAGQPQPPVAAVIIVDAGVPDAAEQRAAAVALAFMTADSDDDGVPDEADRCPVSKEDRDDFEDEDGCPELDNDQDGIADAVDRCPIEAETFNESQDDDGCPDLAPDADKDGVADAIDRCPLEPETRDGVRDDDGCPEYQQPAQATLVHLLAPKPELSEPLPPVSVEGAPVAAPPPPDGDKDGLDDAIDRCPLTAEDLDGFEDDDGCPELDNDDDAVADVIDRCPLEAETINGNRDDDGCPDEVVDVDQDGIGYDDDRCPLEPGNADDGCPHEPLPALALDGFPGKAPPPPSAPTEPTPAPATPAGDFDTDGLPDDVDACPVSAEDRDGFEDEDGCPELDNDQDGIADAADKCPLEAESINGKNDVDGCPDPGAGVVTIEKRAVVIKGTIGFKSGAATLQPTAMPLLQQVASTLKAASTISIEIQGHTDDVGNAAANIRLSKRRAEAIRAVLIKNGVSAARLVANGYGPTRPRASNKTAAGREQNRRVEFLILGEAK